MKTEAPLLSRVARRRSPGFSGTRSSHAHWRSLSSPACRSRAASSSAPSRTLSAASGFPHTSSMSGFSSSFSTGTFVPDSCPTPSLHQLGRSLVASPQRSFSSVSSSSPAHLLIPSRLACPSTTQVDRRRAPVLSRFLFFPLPERVFLKQSLQSDQRLSVSCFLSFRSVPRALEGRRRPRHEAGPLWLVSHRNSRRPAPCSPSSRSSRSLLVTSANSRRPSSRYSPGHTHVSSSSLPSSSSCLRFSYTLGVAFFATSSTTRVPSSPSAGSSSLAFLPPECLLLSHGSHSGSRPLWRFFSRRFASAKREDSSADCAREDVPRASSRWRQSFPTSGMNCSPLPRPPDPTDDLAFASSGSSSALHAAPTPPCSSSTSFLPASPTSPSCSGPLLTSSVHQDSASQTLRPPHPVLVLRAPTAADLSLSSSSSLLASDSPVLRGSGSKAFGSSSFDSFPFLPPHSSAQHAAHAHPSSSSSKDAVGCAGPPRSFEDLGVHAVLLARLKQLGIESPTRTQTSAMSLIDRGRDCVIVDRTGTGKTVAYLLPLINKVYKMHDILLHAQLQGEANRRVSGSHGEDRKKSGLRTTTKRRASSSGEQTAEMEKKAGSSAPVLERGGGKDGGGMDAAKSTEDKREEHEKEGTPCQTEETRSYVVDDGRDADELHSVQTVDSREGDKTDTSLASTPQKEISCLSAAVRGTFHGAVKDGGSVHSVEKEERCLHAKSKPSLHSELSTSEQWRRRRKPEAIGRILQKELFRRREELFYHQRQRHAALPPNPHAWERYLFRRRTQTLREQHRQQHESTRQRLLETQVTESQTTQTSTTQTGQSERTREEGGGEGEEKAFEREERRRGRTGKRTEKGRSWEEGDDKEQQERDAFQDALDSCLGLSPSSPNPLASLRPVVLLLPTHDMVVDALHALQSLDVLGRVQVQCLSSVDKNVRERTTGTEQRERREELLQLKEQMKDMSRGRGEAGGARAKVRCLKSSRQAPPRGEALETGDRSDTPYEPRDASARLKEKKDRTDDETRDLSQGSEADVSRERKQEVERRIGSAESSNKKDEEGNQREVLWMGQRVRRPRLVSDDGEPIRIYTHTRPFSEKKIKMVHELHVQGGEGEGGTMERERWGVLGEQEHCTAAERSTESRERLGVDERSDSAHGVTNEPQKRSQSNAHSAKSEDEEAQSESMEVCRLPVIYRPRIRWGAVDLVITTPHLFLEDLYRFRGEQLYPSMLILDEVDDLLQARGSRTLLMDILGYCRPRVPVQIPHTPKTPVPDFRPCQIVFAGATLAALGPCSSGVMLIERFGNAFEVHPAKRHQLRDEVRQFWIRLNETRIDELLALSRPAWRSERADLEEEDEEELDEGAHGAHQKHFRSRGFDSTRKDTAGSEGDHEAGTAGGQRKRRRKTGMVPPRMLKGREVEILGGRYRVRRKGRSGDQEEHVESSSSSLFEHDQSRRRRRLQASWEHRVDTLLALLTAFTADRTVVFVNSVERCIRLFDFLRDRGWPVVAFHRKMSLKHRTRAVARLLMGQAEVPGEQDESEDDESSGGERSEKDTGLKPASLMVATNLACRGLDLQGVQHVINFDFPTDAVSYIHRVGRTCRGIDSAAGAASRKSDALPFPLVSNFVAEADMPLAFSLFRLQHQDAPLHSAFSRKASFKARYARERQAAREEEGKFGFSARKEDAAQAAAEAWRAMIEAQQSKVDEWRGCSRTVRGAQPGASEPDERSAVSGLRRSDWEEEDGGRKDEGLPSTTDRAESSSSSPLRSVECGARRGGRKTVNGRHRRRGRTGAEGEQPGVVGVTRMSNGGARPDAERDAGSQTRWRLVSRLLQDAVWSADGRSACIEAPRSFYHEQTESDRRKGVRREERTSCEVNKRHEPASGKQRTAAGGGRVMSSMGHRPRALTADVMTEDGREQEKRTDQEKQRAPNFPEGTAIPAVPHATNRALQMRAALFLEDDSDEENSSISSKGSLSSSALQSRSESTRAVMDSGEVSKNSFSETGFRSEVTERRARDARTLQGLSSSAVQRGWTREDYEAFVIRRFQSTEGPNKHRRGIEARLAYINQLQRKAQAMRTKMLMSNFGAGDDFEDEDLKV